MHLLPRREVSARGMKSQRTLPCALRSRSRISSTRLSIIRPELLCKVELNGVYRKPEKWRVQERGHDDDGLIPVAALSYFRANDAPRELLSMGDALSRAEVEDLGRSCDERTSFYGGSVREILTGNRE